MPDKFDPCPQAASLRKYCEAFDLDVSPTAGKEVLIQAVSRHWGQQACWPPDQPCSALPSHGACLVTRLCAAQPITSHAEHSLLLPQVVKETDVMYNLAVAFKRNAVNGHP
jgi:hypothetical protein